MTIGKFNPLNIYYHFKTITEHRHMVIRHCFMAGIPIQGLFHDLSKYSPREFIYGVLYYTGTCSPNVGERDDIGYSNAWMHHQGRNRHHFEYWNDYNSEFKRKMPVKMPLRYVVEMFCDRVAASKIYLGDDYSDQAPFYYFEKNRDTYDMHPETLEFLGSLLHMLKEKGEKYTFSYLRFYQLTHKDY